MKDEFTLRETWKSHRKHFESERVYRGSHGGTSKDFRERRHYELVHPTAEMQLRLMKTITPPCLKTGTRISSVRRVEQPERKDTNFRRVSRFPQQYKSQSHESSITEFIGNKKKVYLPSGDLYSRKPSKELELPNAFGQKVKNYDLDAKRNWIKAMKPGDKQYRDVTMSDNFYRNGGLIPGSTMRPRTSAAQSMMVRSSTSFSKTRPSYETLHRARQIMSEMDGVLSLSQARNGKPSWENKTGNITWSKKKEETAGQSGTNQGQ